MTSIDEYDLSSESKSCIHWLFPLMCNLTERRIPDTAEIETDILKFNAFFQMELEKKQVQREALPNSKRMKLNNIGKPQIRKWKIAKKNKRMLRKNS